VAVGFCIGRGTAPLEPHSAAAPVQVLERMGTSLPDCDDPITAESITVTAFDGAAMLTPDNVTSGEFYRLSQRVADLATGVEMTAANDRIDALARRVAALERAK
jgi:hypothetical protein